VIGAGRRSLAVRDLRLVVDIARVHVAPADENPKARGVELDVEPPVRPVVASRVLRIRPAGHLGLRAVVHREVEGIVGPDMRDALDGHLLAVLVVHVRVRRSL